MSYETKKYEDNLTLAEIVFVQDIYIASGGDIDEVINQPIAFTDLTDVPSSYAGFGGYAVYVRDDESGIEFIPGGGGGGNPPFVTVGFADADYICDGTADDVQIQEAIDYVATQGGGEVFIKGITDSNSFYDITATITVPSNITLSGTGPSSLLKANASMSGTLNMVENDDIASGNTLIVVKDLKFDGNQANRSGAFGNETGSCVLMQKSSYCRYENLTAINGYSSGLAFTQGTNNSSMIGCQASNSKHHNILLVGDDGGTTCYNNTVSGCTAYGAGQGGVFGVGIEVAVYAVNNTVTGCTSNSNLEGGVNIYYRSNSNTVTGCTFDSNTQNGVSIVDEADYNVVSNNVITNSVRGGIVNTISSFARGGNNCTITGNSIVDCGMNGIRGGSGFAHGWVITGNTIDNCGDDGTDNSLKAGVYIVNSDDVKFNDNRVINTTYKQVYMAGMTRLQFNNNHIEDGGNIGASFEFGSTTGIEDSTFNGNIIYNNAQNGLVLLQGAVRCTVVGNVCRSNGQSGIDLRGATDCVISSNISSGNSFYGIRFRDDVDTVGVTYAVVNNNRVTGNTLGGLVESDTNSDYNYYTSNYTVGNTANNFVTVGANDIFNDGGGSITVYSETPSGLINGSNDTYTTVQTINSVLSFAINGQFIHPEEYSAVGTTITFVTPLAADLAGKDFTITFI